VEAPAVSVSPASPAPCLISIVELDFEAKRDSAVPLDQVRASMAAGRFVWIDVTCWTTTSRCRS